MSLHRFFVENEAFTPVATATSTAEPAPMAADSGIGPGPAARQMVRITGEEALHLARVLRLAAGDEIVVCDGSSREYLATLTSVSAKECTAAIKTQRLCPAESQVRICLFQGLAKGDKMEWVIQKATELGVAGIFPVMTKYSVIRLDEAKAANKTQRWERVAKEAAKQCGRALPPVIHPVLRVEDAVTQADVGRVLVPWEGATKPLREVLHKWQADPAPPAVGRYAAGIVIGPEGGLASEEVQALTSIGAVAVSLGPRILRTETAAVATVAAVMYVLGEFGGNRTMDEWR